MTQRMPELVASLSPDERRFILTLERMGNSAPWRSRDRSMYLRLRPWPAEHCAQVRRRLESKGIVTTRQEPPSRGGRWMTVVELTYPTGMAVVAALLILNSAAGAPDNGL